MGSVLSSTAGSPAPGFSEPMALVSRLVYLRRVKLSVAQSVVVEAVDPTPLRRSNCCQSVWER